MYLHGRFVLGDGGICVCAGARSLQEDPASPSAELTTLHLTSHRTEMKLAAFCLDNSLCVAFLLDCGLLQDRAHVFIAMSSLVP